MRMRCKVVLPPVVSSCLIFCLLATAAFAQTKPVVVLP